MDQQKFPEPKLAILCLEDSKADAELICERLQTEGFVMQFDIVSLEKDFLVKIKERKYDVILADFTMPGFNGIAALNHVRQCCPDVPFICVSGTIGEDTAVELLKQGASDYVLKDRLFRLPFAIKRALKDVNEKLFLKKQEEKFKNLVENSLNGIFTTNIAGELLFANKALWQMLGFGSFEEIQKYGVSNMYNDLEDRLLFIKRIKYENRLSNYEIDLKTKKGNIINVIISAYLEESQITGTIIDITERKKFIKELEISKDKAEASDRLKTAFINNISHEVRTPLNGIMGFGELLLLPDISENEKNHYIEILRASSNRLLNTITSYMDISMIESGNMDVHLKTFDLFYLMNSIMEQFRPLCALKMLDLKLQIPQNLSQIQINSDIVLLRKALLHLIDNAIKFTKKGSIVFGYSIEKGLVEFFVKDTGAGVNQEALVRIFDNFEQEETQTTRGYEGSGLGLSIVRGIIRLLGGEIAVESVKGIGSTFSFTIPYQADGSEVKMIESIETKASILGNQSVLVADDDETNLFYLESILKKTNITVALVSNGLEAVEFCRLHPEISLVLMDLKMPVMDGFEATREIKKISKHLPVIAVTAFAMGGDEKKAREAGCDDFIAKPYRRDQLLKLLEGYLVKS